MGRYAYILNSDDSIINEVQYDTFDADAVSHKFGPGLDQRIIPVVKLATPVFDSATHKIGPVNVVEPLRVTKQSSIVARSAQDIKDGTERTNAKAAAQDMFNGVGTQAERLVRVEKSLARVIRDIF